MADAPERMYVRGRQSGAIGTWHDATSSLETAKIANEGGGTRNPFYEYIRADVARADAELAVAEAIRKVANAVLAAAYHDERDAEIAHADILALASADALAEVQRLREARDAALARVEKLREALEKIDGKDSFIDASIRSGRSDRVVVRGDYGLIARAALDEDARHG